MQKEFAFVFYICKRITQMVKMARKSALPLVLSQMIPVYPKKGQPPYYRSKHSIQTSSKLKAFQSCVGDELRGKKFADRKAVKAAFTSAANKCKGR